MKMITMSLLPCLLVLCHCKGNESKITAKLTETGSVAVYPNKGILELDITCLDLNIEKSKQCVVATDNALRAQLKSIGISGYDIHSGSITRQREYAWEKETRKLTGYRTSKTMSIEVEGIEKLESSIDLAFGFKEISITSTFYSHTKYDSLKTEAYIAAIAKLKNRSESIRKTIGSKHCEIIEVSDNPMELSVQTLNPRFANDMANTANFKNESNELNAQPGKMVIEAKASMAIQCEK